MFAKTLKIAFLILAQSITLGHGLFAHHHHDQNSVHCHSHDCDQDSSLLDFGHLFADFSHMGDDVVYTNADSADEISVNNIAAGFDCFVNCYYTYHCIFDSEIAHSPQQLAEKTFYYATTEINPAPRRGPPSLCFA